MNQPQNTHIRCRAIIINDDKLLAVRHVGGDFYALPGGHLDEGEDPIECVKREVVEELGVEIKDFKLRYIHTFNKDGEHNIEFFFLIINDQRFNTLELEKCSHAYELCDVQWLSKNTETSILPLKVWQDFTKDTLDRDQVEFISYNND